MIVLYLSTILNEKGLEKNMKIKPELTGNLVLEYTKIEKRSRAHPCRGPNVNVLPTRLCCFVFCRKFPMCHILQYRNSNT